MTRKPKPDPTTTRIIRLRERLGYKHGAAFARFLGVSKARWNNFERGYPLSKEMIFLLCEKIDGLTSDWLYFGRTRGMTDDLLVRLGERNGSVPNGPETKRRKRRL
jgi:transcriptional regulator with XRE-family HTH domain